MLVWEGSERKTLGDSDKTNPLIYRRYIGVMTLLSVNTTEHERPVYIGMTGMSWGLGTVLGPVRMDETSP